MVTVCVPPKRLDDSFQWLYAKALLFLGVICKIKKEWHTLQEQYLGLSLPNFPLVALAEKVSFLMENWEFWDQAHSDSLAMAYENFLLEVGMYGSPLAWSYREFGNLSTGYTWFKNLWQLVDMFQANLSF